MTDGADRYLGYLPPGLRRKYEESRADPILDHLSQEISLIDVRLKSLVGQLEREVVTREKMVADMKEKVPSLTAKQLEESVDYLFGHMPDNFVDHITFRNLHQLVERYNKNIKDRKLMQADNALQELFDTIREGRRIGDTWEQIEGAMDRRRSLVETEEKRKHRAESYMSVEQVVSIIGVLIEVLRGSVDRYVESKEVRGYILTDAEVTYSKIVGGDSGEEDFIALDSED